MAASPALFEVQIPEGKGTHGTGPGGRVSIVCTQPQPQVYLLTFEHGPDNRLVTAFCEALHLALDIIQHRCAPGVVLTTSALAKFYSNGMDLDHAAFAGAFLPEKLYALWRRLLTYPMPTVAVVNGHAFAGGLMLALMHDYRVMNPRRGYLCLNELQLGVPLRPPMTAVFRMKLSPAALRKLVLEAHRFPAPEALAAGMVDALGGVAEALALVRELQLVQKAQPGATGERIYGELKREMWRETVGLLDGENWGHEHVREARIRDRVKGEGAAAWERVVQWERKNGGVKAKLSWRENGQLQPSVVV